MEVNKSNHQCGTGVKGWWEAAERRWEGAQPRGSKIPFAPCPSIQRAMGSDPETPRVTQTRQQPELRFSRPPPTSLLNARAHSTASAHRPRPEKHKKQTIGVKKRSERLRSRTELETQTGFLDFSTQFQSYSFHKTVSPRRRARRRSIRASTTPWVHTHTHTQAPAHTHAYTYTHMHTLRDRPPYGNLSFPPPPSRLFPEWSIVDQPTAGFSGKPAPG